MKIRTCAQPITLVHEPPCTGAVVCLHGYSGYPGELALVASALYDARFDVFVPRYPGHGTSGDDFIRTGRNDWIAEAERTVRDVSERYAQVSLVGHSMGGAIAVLLASTYAIKRVVLYAPALLVQGLSLPLVTLMGLFHTKKRRPWQPDERYRFYDVRDPDDDAYLGSEYWSWYHPRQLRHLELLRRAACTALGKTSADILVITGGEDATVPKEVGNMVLELGGGRNRWIHLDKATHMIPYDIDDQSRDEAMTKSVEWLLM